VSVVAPFEYTALVWATFLGFTFFGDFPGSAVWTGVAVIVAAGLYTIQRQRSDINTDA
jgi:drug/metabolite transporter (DMT)-like permease